MGGLLDILISLQHIQPFSQKSRTPTVAKEFQIGLYDPAEADSELFCNSFECGIFRRTAVFWNFPAWRRASTGRAVWRRDGVVWAPLLSRFTSLRIGALPQTRCLASQNASATHIARSIVRKAHVNSTLVSFAHKPQATIEVAPALLLQRLAETRRATRTLPFSHAYSLLTKATMRNQHAHAINTCTPHWRGEEDPIARPIGGAWRNPQPSRCRRSAPRPPRAATPPPYPPSCTYGRRPPHPHSSSLLSGESNTARRWSHVSGSAASGDATGVPLRRCVPRATSPAGNRASPTCAGLSHAPPVDAHATAPAVPRARANDMSGGWRRAWLNGSASCGDTGEVGGSRRGGERAATAAAASRPSTSTGCVCRWRQ